MTAYRNKLFAKLIERTCKMPRLNALLIFFVCLTGCSDNRPVAVTATTDFEGASAENIQINSNSKEVVFSIRRDPGGDEHLWFYFKLEADNPIKPKFTLREPSKTHFFDWSGVRPVVSEDGQNWYRAKKINYRFISPQKIKNPEKEDKFTFYSPISSKILYVAYSFPYTSGNLNEYLYSIQEDNRVSIISIGKSDEDRDIFCMTIENRKISHEEKKEIWIIAREHPGETPCSYVLEGVMHNLLNSEYGNVLLEKYTFQIVPLLNIDGVVGGNYYRNQKGQRLDLGWGEDKPKEIDLLLSRMKPGLESGKIKLLLSLHSANAPDGHFFIERSPDQLPTDLRLLQKNIIDSSNGLTPHYRSNSTVEMWERPDIAGNLLPDKYQTLCLYFESNYNLGADGSYVSRRSLRDAGAALTSILSKTLVD